MVWSERRTGQGIEVRSPAGAAGSPSAAASKVSSMRVRTVRVHPNKRLKLTAHVELNDYFFFSAPQLRRDPLGSPP